MSSFHWFLLVSFLKLAHCRYEYEKPIAIQSPYEGSTATIYNEYSRCGVSNKKNAFVVSANQTSLRGDWPWMVALNHNYRTSSGKAASLYKCGASLISNRWLLTAAHCVYKKYLKLTARLGDLDLNDNGEDTAMPININVEDVILHPEYSQSKPYINNIALVRLSDPVTFTKFISPICLLSDQKDDKFYDRKVPFLVGWNQRQRPRKPVINVLKDSQVEVVANENCAEIYQNKASMMSPIDQRVVCVLNQGPDTCHGCSGGALIIPIESTYYLAGITSYGLRCSDSDVPAVFTKVAYFDEWIKQTINE